MFIETSAKVGGRPFFIPHCWLGTWNEPSLIWHTHTSRARVLTSPFASSLPPSLPPLPQAGFNIKPLFRKLATALPGMESAQSQGNANLIDIKLAAAPTASSEQADARSRCAC